jgi:exopolysaccharide biosynthesis protein
MTLPELAQLLEALGVDEALNLDGGGSSTLVVDGRPANRPSDPEGERAVVNALALVHDSAGCAR